MGLPDNRIFMTNKTVPKKGSSKMDYRIIKERVDDQTVWALMEYRENMNEPWTCIAEDTDRARLARYKKKLENGWLVA